MKLGWTGIVAAVVFILTSYASAQAQSVELPDLLRGRPPTVLATPPLLGVGFLCSVVNVSAKPVHVVNIRIYDEDGQKINNATTGECAGDLAPRHKCFVQAGEKLLEFAHCEIAIFGVKEAVRGSLHAIEDNVTGDGPRPPAKVADAR